MSKMIKTLITAGALVVASQANAASFSPIAGLNNTGTNVAGGKDLSWDVSSLGGAYVDATVAVPGPATYPLAGDGSIWALNNGTSSWITPSALGYGNEPTGAYNYSLQFDLTGLSQLSASFTGRFLVDNVVTGILLNGNALTLNGPGGYRTGQWVNFAANGSNGFISGLNTLTFLTTNNDNPSPTGLRVEFLSSAAAVPEPATWAMMIAGFAVVGFALRRQRQNVTVRFA